MVTAGRASPVPRRWRTLVVAPLAALLVGCGSAEATDETPQQAAQSVHGAFATTVDAGSARFDLDVRMTARIGGRDEQASMTGTGVFDFARRASQAMFTTPLGIDIEVRTVGVDFYERAPAQLRRRFPGNRPWMRFNFEAADRAQYGGPLYVFRPTGGDDPWQMLGVLPAVSATRLVGEATVDGTRTRHYRATLRLADMAGLDAATGPARRRFQQKVGVDQVPVEVWLDDAGRLRRVRATVPLRLAGAEWTGTSDTVTGEATATLELSDLGTAVSVSAPPADQVDDLTDLVADGGLRVVGELIGAI